MNISSRQVRLLRFLTNSFISCISTFGAAPRTLTFINEQLDRLEVLGQVTYTEKNAFKCFIKEGSMPRFSMLNMVVQALEQIQGTITDIKVRGILSSYYSPGMIDKAVVVFVGEFFEMSIDLVVMEPGSLTADDIFVKVPVSDKCTGAISDKTDGIMSAKSNAVVKSNKLAGVMSDKADGGMSYKSNAVVTSNKSAGVISDKADGIMSAKSNGAKITNGLSYNAIFEDKEQITYNAFLSSNYYVLAKLEPNVIPNPCSNAARLKYIPPKAIDKDGLDTNWVYFGLYEKFRNPNYDGCSGSEPFVYKEANVTLNDLAIKWIMRWKYTDARKPRIDETIELSKKSDKKLKDPCGVVNSRRKVHC